MKQTLMVFILIILLRTNYAQKTHEPNELIYHIEIQITPESGGIKGMTEIQNPKDSVFFLAKGLTIQSIIADGRKITFRQTIEQTGSSVEISLCQWFCFTA
jgi:hypothetical protein